MDSNTDTSVHWLVTGASSGIGRAVALRLAAAGQGVMAWGRDTDRLATLRRPGLTTQSIDLLDVDTWGPALDHLLTEQPTLRGVVHCAGIQHDQLLADPGYGYPQIDEELRLNLAMPAELLRRLRAPLAARPGAGVVLTSSALAFAPKHRAALYSASKAGVHALCESVRAQWQADAHSRQLQLMELIPPLVDTPMTTGRGRRKLTPEQLADRLVPVLLSKTWPPRLWVGAARALPMALRLAPHLVQQRLLRATP